MPPEPSLFHYPDMWIKEWISIHIKHECKGYMWKRPTDFTKNSEQILLIVH